jgi:hypothetical protein
MYIIVVVGLAILYIVTGTKLLMRLNKSKNLGRNVKLRRVRRALLFPILVVSNYGNLPIQATVKMLIGAGCLLGFLLFAIMFASGAAYYPIRKLSSKSAILMFFLFIITTKHYLREKSHLDPILDLAISLERHI